MKRREDAATSSMGGSSYGTGGGGVVLEHAYGARVLAALLLARSLRGLGDDYEVIEVAFQARGVAIDDIVIVGRTGHGEERHLAVAVRRDPTVGKSDEKFVALIADALRLVGERRTDIEHGRWRIGLAVAEHHSGTRELAELTEHARSHPSNDGFRAAIEGTRAALRSRLKLVDEVVAAAMPVASLDPATTDQAELTWRLLAALWVCDVRLEGDAAPERTAAIAELATITDDPAGVWARLCQLAGTYAPRGARVNEAMLRRDLSGSIGVRRSPRLQQAWTVLDALDDQLALRTRGELASGDSRLVLPRNAAREDLVRALSRARALIVAGEPDVGKSALALDAVRALRSAGGSIIALNLGDAPVNVVELEHLLGVRLAAAFGGAVAASTRLVVVDGAETILEGRRDLFVAIAAAAFSAGLGVVAVTRNDAARAVREAMSEVLRAVGMAQVDTHEVPGLDQTEVDEVAASFPALARVASEPRARWLLERPGLIDLLLRADALSVLPIGAIGEAHVFAAVWGQHVRCGEDRTPGEATSDGREQALVELARRRLQPASSPQPISDTLALASLRSDRLLLPFGANAPWRAGDDFANDLVRDFSVARLLLTCRFELLRSAGAPRWALRAARLACQARLAEADARTEPLRQELQAIFDTIAAASGDRWAEIPWEALITSPTAEAALRDAWPALESAAGNHLRRLLRLVMQRHTKAGAADPQIAGPIVGLLTDRAVELRDCGKESIDAAAEVTLSWLRGLAGRRHADTPDTLRQRLRDLYLSDDHARDSKERLERLALLGPDADARALEKLRTAAREHPHRLERCVEEPYAVLALAIHHPALLRELAEAYYIEPADPDGCRRDLRGVFDQGIRDHRYAGGGEPFAAYYRGPFLALLQVDPVSALGVINRILNHAAEHRALMVREDTGPVGLTLDFPDVGKRFCPGDSHTWAWYRGSTVGPSPAMSALMAVEHVADEWIAAGIPVARVVRLLLADCHNLAMPGLVVGLLVRHVERVTDELDSWLSDPSLWELEFNRVIHESSGLARRDESPRAARRQYSLREVAFELVVRAIQNGDDRRIARLAEIADALCIPGESSGFNASAVQSWASVLRAEHYQRLQRDDGRVGYQYTPPAEIVTALAEPNAQIQRGGEGWRLLTTYATEDPPTTDLVTDIAAARAYLADPPDTGPADSLEPPAAVAAAAVRAHAVGKIVLRTDDLAWAIETLVGAATRIRPDSLETERSIYAMGADRSAARGLSATLLPAFDGHACAEADAPPERNVMAALSTLASSWIDEVRRFTAEALAPVWVAPCGRGADTSGCRHVVALDAVLAGAFHCQLGPWNPHLGRCDREPLEGPIAESLPAVPTEMLLIDQLTASIVAAGGCVASGCCASASSRILLDVLLDAHRRGAAHWADKGYHRDDADRRAVAAVLLAEAAAGRPAALDAHLDTFVDQPAALAEFLRDLSFLATYDAAQRSRFAAVWPAMMDGILDAVASGHELRGDRYFHDHAVAAIVPAPQIAVTDTDIDETLRSAADGWPTVDDLGDRIERWLPLAVGTVAAVDSLIGFLRRATPAVQADVGLRWILRLVEGHVDRIAGRSFHLPSWLEELREGGHLQNERRRDYERLIDALAAAGDTRVVPLQNHDE